ncbi:MAG: transglutaminase domain-containing protein [Lachnospiraceae bacterium]|nr:transglutaminase domain-containing protein [Lachnospiraceae bacterium]
MEANRKAYAVRKWEIRRELLGDLGLALQEEMQDLEPEVRDWMTYLMATLPLSDLSNYPLSAWIPYIEHALMLRSTLSWCRELSEDMFTDYVFYPRINTEDIEECRRLFYSLLEPRIQGKDMPGAVLETNYWCQENVTYQMADDRTKSAITAYRSCGGRCGEESTFTVTALRSIGIPSRQVYSPWWPHCDDNHAWVEVYVDGEWKFLGACEAAPKLNTGWFTNASSRSMIVHARTFTGASCDEELKELYGDTERTRNFHVENGVTYEHVTSLYAELMPVTVTVLHEDGTPAAGARVRLEVLNMAEFMCAADMTTNGEGKVWSLLGKGQIHLHALEKAGDKVLLAEEPFIVTEEGDNCVNIVLKDEAAVKEKNGQWIEYDYYAPLDKPVNPGLLTEEEKEEKNRKMAEALELRTDRKLSYYDDEVARNYCGAVQTRLKDAVGNFSEVAAFLNDHALNDKEFREDMVLSLSLKDMTDVKARVLEEHLICSVEYAQDYKREIFVPYVLCPRVFNETLTAYRTFILGYFEESQLKRFRKDPASVMEWIDAHLRSLPEMEYGDLFYTPSAALRSGLMTDQSRKILFVAICRTLGVAARINPNSKEVEYWKGRGFVSAEKQVNKNVRMVLKAEDPKEWINRQTFTLSRLSEGMYQRIDMPEINEHNAFELMLEEGQYRLITANRLPNGHIYAYLYYFEAKAGRPGRGEVVISLQKREARMTEILSRNPIVDFPLRDEEGNKVMAASLLEKNSNLFIWIEEGKEPTEHILNEMLAQVEDFRSFPGDIFFVLRNREAKEQVTLKKAMDTFPDLRICYDDFQDNVEALGRRMYVDFSKLPLVVLMNGGLCGVYASCGYNVGLGDLLLKIVKAFES